MLRASALHALSVSAAILLSACSGGGGGSTSTPPPPPPVSPASTLSLLAGTTGGEGSIDGPRTTARFNNPSAVAVDRNGTIYVADRGNATIRKIDAGGMVSTLAGQAGSRGSTDGTGSSARFDDMHSIAADSLGNVYVYESSRIRKVTPAGVVSTVTATVGLVYLAGDLQGNMYWAGAQGLVRKMAPDGAVTTIASIAGADMRGIAVDAAGNVYVSEANRKVILRIAPDGAVSTFAGVEGVTSRVDGPRSAATFAYPAGLAFDGAGNLLVIDNVLPPSGPIPPAVLRRVDAAGNVTTIATLSGFILSLGLSPSGDVFVPVDSRIERVAGAERSTFAGSARPPGDRAFQVVADGNGGAFVAGPTVRHVSATGVVTTVYSPAPGAGVTALAIDPSGVVYVATTACVQQGAFSTRCSASVHRLIPEGSATTVIANAAQVERAEAMAVDAAGTIFVGDVGSGRTSTNVKRLTLDGQLTVLSTSIGGSGSALELGPTGTVYASVGALITRIDPGGSSTILVKLPDALPGLAANISGMGRDAAGNLYVSDIASHTIRKVTPSGESTIVAGTPGVRGFVPGPLPGVLDAPWDVAVSGMSLIIGMESGVAVVTNRP